MRCTCDTQRGLCIVFGRNMILKLCCCSYMSSNTGGGTRARHPRDADTHIDTSHDYDGEKASACLALAPVFINDTIGLYQTLTGTQWE